MWTQFGYGVHVVLDRGDKNRIDDIRQPDDGKILLDTVRASRQAVVIDPGIHTGSMQSFESLKPRITVKPPERATDS